MKRTFCASLLALAVLLTLIPAASAASLGNFEKVNSYTSGQFTDVAAGVWYEESVRTTYELDLFKGSSATTFSPAGNISIAETLALACRLHSIYHNGTALSGQSSPWYQVYVDYALSNGIIQAGQYSRYDAIATRAQFASILAASLDSSALSAINSIASGAIPDVPASASYADSVYLLYNAGILTGRDAQGSFSPQATIQRCEAAAIVARMAVPSLRQTFTLKPSSGRVLVAQPLEQDPLNQAVTADSVVIQDLVEFCNGGLTYDDIGQSGVYNVRSFEGTEADKAIVDAYVDALCSGGYNLTLVEEYDKTMSSTFFSYGLNYTGTGNVSSKTTVTYTETEATINIYGVIKRGDMDVHVWIPQQMEQVDLGLRYGQEAVSVSVAGPSAMAGLYRNADGSFETSDGRLKTTLGQASVLRDGAAYSAAASFQTNEELSRDELWVDSFYRNESFFFCSPMDALMTGDVYTRKDLTQEASWVNNKVFASLSEFGGYRWNLFFGAGHDGDFITPLLGERNEYKDLTVRVMYWNKDVEAVYYIYAEFDSSPYTLEALVAVELGATAETADGVYTLSPGGTVNITCPTEFGTNYQLFSWEAVEGAGNVTLTGANSQTCTIRAGQSGTALVRVTYTYGVDEPDVLTGIPRNVEKQRTYTYRIEIQ
ncbi:S-layer homology domain-containing protein [Pseudoflavonifractor sp.]|jgi:hypothetical protein|uniref:S-layer homology domain-containing protein n=1 Tax=Pseudoflavonifractor sp. TaxID=1980281 RepID=UPI003D90AA4B